MARKIKSEIHVAGGLEGTVDFAALCVVILGILAILATVALLQVSGVLPAFFIFTFCAIVWLMLRALAEILRLLKKLADIPYSGNISAGQQTTVYRCSNCGAMLHSETRCDSCSATIGS